MATTHTMILTTLTETFPNQYSIRMLATKVNRCERSTRYEISKLAKCGKIVAVREGRRKLWILAGSYADRLRAQQTRAYLNTSGVCKSEEESPPWE